MAAPPSSIDAGSGPGPRYKRQDFSDGGQYRGGWRDGVPHGMGTSIDPHGNQYCGMFVSGVPQGMGTHVHSNGERYVGHFTNGKRHGVGVWTHPSGDQYIGEFNNDARQGQGTYYQATGGCFTGTFKAGVPLRKGALPRAIVEKLQQLQVYGDAKYAGHYAARSSSAGSIRRPSLVSNVDGASIYAGPLYGDSSSASSVDGEGAKRVDIVIEEIYDFSQLMTPSSSGGGGGGSGSGADVASESGVDSRQREQSNTGYVRRNSRDIGSSDIYEVIENDMAGVAIASTSLQEYVTGKSAGLGRRDDTVYQQATYHSQQQQQGKSAGPKRMSYDYIVAQQHSHPVEEDSNTYSHIAKGPESGEDLRDINVYGDASAVVRPAYDGVGQDSPAVVRPAQPGYDSVGQDSPAVVRPAQPGYDGVGQDSPAVVRPAQPG